MEWLIAYAAAGLLCGMFAAVYEYQAGQHMDSAGAVGLFVACFWPAMLLIGAIGLGARWVVQHRKAARRQTQINAVLGEPGSPQDRRTHQRGHMTVELATVGGAGLVGLFTGAATWPTWWPEWTAWLWLAMGTTLGVLTAKLAWWRVKP